MRIGRATRIGVFCLAAAVLLGGSGIIGCTVGGDSNDNVQPTDPSPSNAPPQRGSLTITPSEFTLTIRKGTSPGGQEEIFRVTGGAPPYSWANSGIDIGYLVPIDEFGRGYYSAAMYRFLNHPERSGDDTILVRDGRGDSVTAKVTLTLEDATAPPAPAAPTITPATATIISGSSITLVASGGDGTNYAWTTSDPTSSFTPPSGTGKTVTLNTVAFTGTADVTITVTVTSATLTGTATITVSPTGP